ncbi:MAG: lipopolysaccharide assembly protein LapA domain-containing protein [Nocardioides sp.]
MADEQQAPMTGSGEIPDQPEPRRTPPTKDPLRRSRTSMLWVATVGFGLVLLLLIVLVLQNTQKVEFTFLWWEGTPPLAAALLIAAAGGIAITAIAGSLRILQLRRRVKRR